MPVTTPPTVYVIDDDPLVLAALVKVITDANLPIETYTCGEDFLSSYRPANPGCILIDVMMPGINGLELQEALKLEGNCAPIIFLSGAGTVHISVDALKSGAMDFLEKPINAVELVETVEKAMKLDLVIRYKQLQRSHIDLKVSRLTPREVEVMKWMLDGRSNKMIARILDISSRTVEIHRGNIIRKMEANSLVELSRMISETKK
jgi:FixJ family two-component response regulator